MSSINSGNALDAGASSALKHTDLSEGIHEDVSSDLTREAGPGGKKQPWPISDSTTGHTIGGTGGTLDQLGGNPKHLGSDASKITGSTFDAGISSATNDTDLTDSIHEDASRGIESIKGATSRVTNSTNMNSNLPQLGEGSYHSSNISNTASGVFDRVKETVSGVFGGASGAGSKSASAMDAGASASIKGTDLTEGIHEDAGRGIESVKGATTRTS